MLKRTTATKSNIDLKLISLVKANPALYDHNDANYLDFNAREVAWQKIGDQMKHPAAECKARWINIRDINRRILIRTMKVNKIDRKYYKYHKELEFMIPFYRDIKLKNAALSEGHNSDSSAEDIANEQYDNKSTDELDDDLPLGKTKRILKDSTLVSKKQRIHENTNLNGCQNRAGIKIDASDNLNIEGPKFCIPNNQGATKCELNPSDNVDSFLLSVGAIMKTFTPYYLNLAKSKIFSIVQEYELEQLVAKTTSDSAKLKTE